MTKAPEIKPIGTVVGGRTEPADDQWSGTAIIHLNADFPGGTAIEDGLAAVFTSDLARAVETASLAFADTDIPILHDWRLRECDYGAGNGMPAIRLHRNRSEHLDTPYPGGESWRQAVRRVGRFLGDLSLRWSDTRVLVIGHVATRWAFDHLIDDVPLEKPVDADFGWREGWEYRLA